MHDMILDSDLTESELENDDFVNVATVRIEFGALMREVFEDYLIDLSE